MQGLHFFLFASFLVPAFPAYSAYVLEELAVLPEGSVRVVRGINAQDAVVGGARVNNKQQGFKLKGRSLQSIEGLPGSDHTIAFGINDLGEVVGSANRGKAVRAFRQDPSNAQVDLGTLPGDTASEALTVNGTGDAAGYSSGASGIRAVVWSKLGAIQALPKLPGEKSSRALALNDKGDAAGVSVAASGPRAVLWSEGAARDLGALSGHTVSEALAINKKGDVVGSSGNPQRDRHATLWNADGGVEDLGTLDGAPTSRALWINNSDEVVGVSQTPHGSVAFLWTRAQGMQDLNALTPGRGRFVLTQAVSINDNGVILAIGQEEVEHNGDGHSHDLHELPVHVFLLRPER
jgi:probable HAF family extracellular repeat protein